MFAQTECYKESEALGLRINIPKVEAVSSLGSGYRFLWLKSDSQPTYTGATTNYSMLTLDPDLPAVTSYPDSAYGVMLDSATTDQVDWQLQESPTSILSLTSSFQTTTTAAYSIASSFIPVVTPTTWSAGSGVGSGRSLMDNSWTYVAGSTSSGIYNSTLANPWCVATLSVGNKCQLYQLRYDFATDSTNYRKKIKYIDIYKWDVSAWVLVQTFTTTSPVIGASSSAYLVLTTPLDLDASLKQIKIQCRSNWGDPNGYYWVSEIVPYVKQL